MSTTTEAALNPIAPARSPLLDQAPPGIVATLLFIAILLGGLSYIGYELVQDVTSSTAAAPWELLLLAVQTALGFEFVNGVHDTANAVATVIYTRSLAPQYAVMWSGLCNFLGVLSASGAVAWGIVSLLPVELILQVNSSAGMAMVFALLAAAIIWNLGTWWLGLPASSSHTLIGSIIGVGLANQLLAANGAVTSGVDWGKARDVGMALLVSPILGFVASGALLLLLKAAIRNPALFKEPDPGKAPPWWIRGTLILTCTGVSFAHGSNDGQKGMGLIMLILIGVVPTAYALNRAPPEGHAAEFIASAQATSKIVEAHAAGFDVIGDPRPAVTDYIHAHKITEGTYPSLAILVQDISQSVKEYGSVAKTPLDKVENVRNDMYLASEALRVISKDKESELTDAEKKEIGEFKKQLDFSTKFIPIWVKVSVAIALGLGTMVGWKRIVVTVGEKIGKTHLTYGQGAAAELVAAATIGAADGFGLPVSTTHVLSSGVAGTMVANGSGMQWSTVRNLALAWVLTLPIAMLLSGALFFLFRHIF